ncbi:kinase-like protein [Rhizoctonia solani]|uniref:Kinase-like protein n=1 Tax=Rhizoctonia solani TaxID=456999 RepID=A0A8H7IMQ8_9AGAM|nr:kinase-like protein [Rhizoctonia solani]
MAPETLPMELSSVNNTLDSLVDSRVCDRCYGLIYGHYHTAMPLTVEPEPYVTSELLTADSNPPFPLLAHSRPSNTSSGVSSGYTRIRRRSAQQSSSTISSFQSTYFNHSIQSNSGGGGSLSSTPSALGLMSLNYPQRAGINLLKESNNESDLWLPSQLRGSRTCYRPSRERLSLDEDALSLRSQVIPSAETGNGGNGKPLERIITPNSPGGVDELVRSEQTIRADVPNVIISGAMSNAEILAHLGKHGCIEVTNDIDASKSIDYPVVAGGFGDIYRGMLYDGTQVSIKCLRLMLDSGTTGRKHVKRAAHELYVWSKCNHPNVLEVYGVARYRNQIAMISPWMENGNLSQFLSRRPQVDRCALCIQIADGAAYLHSQGIVNVLVAHDYTLKLADFWQRKFKGVFSTIHYYGKCVEYFTPLDEVVFGDTGHSVEADVYALGMEVITGAVPYAGISDVTVFAKVMQNIQPTRPEQHIRPETHRPTSYGHF